jgi:hypothetical protein
MNRTFTFGIVGGYGATGRVVASELSKSSKGEILIGGPNLAKATTLANEYNSRVSAAALDVRDASSLDEFCSRCSIIVNCAGPVTVLQDLVAQAAFRNRCHYIDAAGMSIVKERLLPHNREIQDLGLRFVVSAGWMPGLSELLPVYAIERARTRMETIESLEVYFGDSGEWSVNALRDGVSYIRQIGLRSPGYYHKGKLTRAKRSAAIRKIDLGDPFGARRFALFLTPELSEIGRRLSEADVFTCTYLSGYRAALISTLIAVVPLPEAVNVCLLRSIFRSNRLPVDGFVVARVIGRSQGRRLTLVARIVYEDRRDYWIHGVVLGTVARMVSAASSVRAVSESDITGVASESDIARVVSESREGEPRATLQTEVTESNAVKPGVYFLAEVADPIAIMDELRKAGLDQSEYFEP